MWTTSLIISIVSLIFTILFGAGAIWLSLYFYRNTSHLYDSIKDLLHKIDASSSITEVLSKEFMNPVVAMIVSILRDSTRSQVDSLGRLFTSRLEKNLELVFKAETPEEKGNARKEFMKEMGNLLGRLRGDIGRVGISFEPEALAPQTDTDAKSSKAPAAPIYNWLPFIKSFKEIENSQPRGFVSVKWLREKKFEGNKEYQQALQMAIEQGILTTYSIDNPRKPAYPVLCCKLNGDNILVIQVLDRIAKL